ncbi:MAG: hypothetical protein U5R06_21595 [candidate division KSB1 bacterium]|nr:hypothetical protein [candidate division KSB1 bacterium]
MKHPKIYLCMAVIVLVLAAGCGVKPPTAENIRLSAIFSDHMVLQRDMDIPVWGKADPGGYVQVKFADQLRGAAVAEDSSWSLKLKPVRAGGPYSLSVIGADTTRFEDVLVGEVWLCSGQSNMNWSVRFSMNSEPEIKNAVYPTIRLCTVKQAVADTPRFSF